MNRPPENDDLLIPDDVAAEALPQSPYGQPVEELPPQAFQPWHRPRKHFVRTRQWASMVRTLLDEVITGDVLDYLGLPGRDLMDLELFLNECVDRSKMLRYLGFDTAAAEQTADAVQHRVNADIVIRSQGVHRDSIIVPDDIYDLATPRSRARDVARKRTFDVVNLDLCGARIKGASGEDGLYETLDNILELQSSRDQPWLLLITTAFDRNGATAKQLLQVQQLADRLQDRMHDCPESNTTSVLTSSGTLSDSSDGDFSLVAVAGMVSWLWERSQGHRPSNVKFVSLMGYRLQHNSTSPDMLSLGIKFNPKSRLMEDLSGVLPPRDPNGLQSGCEQLAQMFGRLSSMKDVDATLRENEEIFDECRAATADLLARRGYDRDEYYRSRFSRHIDEDDSLN